MKKAFKIYLYWLLFWLGIFTILGLGYFAIKARQSSSSWLTVDSSSPAALYVGAGETLTAAKRNRLVQKANWEEVATSVTAIFDSNCERKFQRNLSPYNNNFFVWDIRVDWTRISSTSGSTLYYIENTNKWTIKSGTNSWPTLHIRKRCQ